MFCIGKKDLLEKDKNTNNSNIIQVHLNSRLNTLRTFNKDVETNDITDFMIIARHKDGYAIYRTPMDTETEITMAAQLSANVNARHVLEIISNQTIVEDDYDF
jgi:hypothetical protein